jgi:hypothetical protein
MGSCIIIAHRIKHVVHAFSLEKLWIGVILFGGFSYIPVNMVCLQMILNFFDLLCH